MTQQQIQHVDENIDNGDGHFSIIYRGKFFNNENPTVASTKGLKQSQDINFAVKFIKLDKFNKENTLRRFLVECEICLKHLNHSHPNVLKYYGAYFPENLANSNSDKNSRNSNRNIEIISDLPCLVSAYMEGGNLKNYLKNCNNFTVQNALDYSEQLAEGLEYLHSIQVYHGDLACRNLLLTKDSADKSIRTEFVLKIADFGLSGTATEYSNYNSKMPEKHMEENPGYASRWAPPEVRRKTTGQHNTTSCIDYNDDLKSTTISNLSDVWSFAVTVWEMFTRGETPKEFTRHQLIHERIRLSKPVFCPKAMYLLLMRCWQKDSANRPNIRTINKLLKKLILSHYDQVGISDEELRQIIPGPIEMSLVESKISKINVRNSEKIKNAKLTDISIGKACRADPSLCIIEDLKFQLKYFIYPNEIVDQEGNNDTNVVEYMFYDLRNDCSSVAYSSRRDNNEVDEHTCLIQMK